MRHYVVLHERNNIFMAWKASYPLENTGINVASTPSNTSQKHRFK